MTILALLLLILVIEAHGFTVRSGKSVSTLKRHSTALNNVIECTSTESSSFDDQLKTSKWAIVDFYADWCGPCKIAAKTFAQIADEYPDKEVQFIKVDTEIFEDTVDEFGLKGLPVFGVFKDGKIVKKHEGNIGKDKLLEFIQTGIKENE